MKKITFGLLLALLAGCASLQEKIDTYYKNFDTAEGGKEIVVHMPYDAVFSATLRLLTDSELKILDKSAEKKIIFFEDDMEAVTYGFGFKDQGNNQTKIILKAFKNSSWATYNILERLKIRLDMETGFKH